MRNLSRFIGVRPLAIVLLLSVALISTACIGDTASNGTPGCAKVNSGCYGATYWNAKNGTKFVGTPYGVMSKIYLRSMTCNASCKAEHGFIEDYLLLGDSGLQKWYRFGFRRDENGFYYFAEQNNDVKNVSLYNIDAVQNVDVYNYLPSEVMYDSTYTSPVVSLYATPLSAPTTTGIIFNAPNFTPGSIEVAQLLYGTNGEGAEDSDFVSLRYRTVATSTWPLIQNYPNLLTNIGYGTLLHDNPPFPSWFGNNIDGDTFTAYCCQQ
jgi:hypothetical protein